ncbi:MAG: acylneuraminate cytidylyltransferase family protein [Candidatus Methanoperedens sp.]|nr:acylneuraminate cytidylyltransferase family protein [Candidatus Methanoperedens sp.]
MKVIAVIPARGGSKGVPRKNIKLLAGKPLIAYTIETALQSKSLDRVIVSTDDEEIAKIARQYGAEVPFMRPKELAGDTVPDLPVFKHALNNLEKSEGYRADLMVNLRPTAPLRTVDDIYNGVNKLINTNADSVRSVCKVEHHPYWMLKVEGDRAFPLIEGEEEKYPRRQDLPPIYRLNGAVDVSRRDNIIEKNTLYGKDMRVIIMDQARSIDIDTEIDFTIAEMIIKGFKH